MKTKINEAIKHVLQQFGNKYFIGEALNKNKVIQDLDTYDKDLLEAFISDEILKSNFTIDIAGNLVLQTNKLIELFETDEYWQDSYTKYSKKIGLAAGGKFIDESTDVVLDFPYKDTVLKASMSKEDTDKGDLRPDEPFLNKVISKEEIDVLLDKKILVNARKYDENGVYEVGSFSEKDNLIIKGNNLLALHTLKEMYARKVKLVYIDPPYNTGNDSFRYNDHFNHSTWLTFMKNRLDIVKDFMSQDGVIFVHCDNNEQSYLKVLMDEVFGHEQFIETITVVNNPRGRDYGGIANMHEFIHVYAKSKDDYNIYRITDLDKKFPYSDEISGYEIRELRNRNTAFHIDNRPNLHYPFYVNPNKELDNGFLELSLEPKEGFVEVYPAESMGIKTVWRWGKEKSLQNLNINVVGKAMSESGRYMIVEKYRNNSQMARSVWNDKSVNSERGTVHLRELFGKKVFSFPKPEDLLHRILSIATKENDLVLDFFMGSATTQAVSHKMNRKYIGIEQMDYLNEVSVPRLQKVIEGEQGGVSRHSDVNWQGGGSFVYAELMEKNRGFLTATINAKTQSELQQVFDFMLDEAEIDFRVDLEAVKDTLHELPFEDQKKTLFKIIDKNQLYYNYSEIDDANVRDLISDDDYSFNKHFYDDGSE